MDRLNSAASAPPRPRSGAGFTLLEVMVALGILAFGLLGVAAMQIHAMHGGRSARHTTHASEIARAQLETFQSARFVDLAPTPGWTVAQVVTRDVQADGGTITEQSYDLQWRISDLNAVPTLKSVDVQVTWNEPERPNRTVTLSTLRFDE